MQNQRTRVSGHIARVKRTRGDQWYARYRLPDGRTAQKHLGEVWKGRGRPPEGFLTKRMAEDRLHELLADARRGLLAERADPSGATFKDAVKEWLRYVEAERGCRATTIREYRTAVYKHLVPVFGNDRLEDITTRRLEIWKARLLDSDTVSRRTINKLITNAHGIFERASDPATWGLEKNPVKGVKRLREHYDPGDFGFFTKEEVWALVRTTRARTQDEDVRYESHQRREVEEFLAEQDAAIFLTAAFAGLRLGELLGLRWRDIDFENEVIRVTQQLDDLGEIAPTKGKRVRAVPMVPPVAQALAALSQHGLAPGDDDPVFVGVRYAQRFVRVMNTEEHEPVQDAPLVATRVDRSALTKRYKKARDAAGLRPLRFHDLRHTFGSLAVNYAEGPRELQDMMGHSDYRTTQRYLHHRQRADAARRLAPAFEIEEPVPAVAEVEVEAEAN
jgi:integrase